MVMYYNNNICICDCDRHYIYFYQDNFNIFILCGDSYAGIVLSDAKD